MLQFSIFPVSANPEISVANYSKFFNGRVTANKQFLKDRPVDLII